MQTRAVILAGGEGSRLGVLTAKRAKPAVPFAGKYRIIDFPLSNCVNSNIFDVMIIAQYRPQSLIEHIGAGSPWDLNRDFTGGVRIFTPYKARRWSDWFVGTADAIQQNFAFIKQGSPEMVLILSGDHIYSMDYETMVTFHQDHHADLTLATIQVPIEEASRFGIVEVDESYRVVSFIEKPPRPASNLVNMGVYLFNTDLLDRALWEDHNDANSSHDFGKDILPHLIAGDKRVFAYPFSGYWVDVGAVSSYWQAHMDLLNPDPPLDLNNRSWIIHTRTEERPPARLLSGAKVEDSLVADGCVIEPGARVVRSVLSPGVHIRAGAQVMESILFTDVQVQAGARVQRAIVDKRVVIGEDARVGALNYPTRSNNSLPVIAMLGKNSVILPKMVIEPGASIGTDVIASDYPAETVRNGEFIQTRRMPYEI